MAVIEVASILSQFGAVLDEAMEGPPPQQRWSYFTDQGPDAGLLGVLATLGAEEASRVDAEGRRTIAAHVHHVCFAIEASAAWIRGDRSRRDWAQSWRLNTVDAVAWRQLQDEVRKGYQDLRAAIASNGITMEDAFGGAIGAIAHIAYHLGAIRQKCARLRTSSTEG